MKFLCSLIGHKWKEVSPFGEQFPLYGCPRCRSIQDEETGEPRSLWEWIAWKWNWKWYQWKNRHQPPF